ncbi:TraR/DksA family transcriptional regulator [Chitinivorax sp. B]|uniref:TraR/DksA family transcriptional regulator n=1 Tax=Chitinivorax sp. B TaxID=2502235 RepID=UPI0010F7F1F2|nr:TraR/DksA family transcriptional regulator [Chitinivorax sp. B]
MSDVYDRAQALEARQRAEAIARQQAATALMLATPGQSHCDDCGERIAEARRQAMPCCTRCVDCQSIRERRR